MQNNNPETLEILHIMDICIQIEEKCAELYYNFAARFEQIPEVNEFWKQMAIEEENHANEIKMAVRLKGCGIDKLNLNISTVRQLLNNMIEIVKKTEKAPPDLNSALHGALKIEERLTACHITCVADFKDSSMSKLFSKMSSNDEMHALRLKKALDQGSF